MIDRILHRRLLLVAASSVAIARGQVQSPATPKFEVASIKLCRQAGFSASPGRKAAAQAEEG